MKVYMNEEAVREALRIAREAGAELRDQPTLVPCPACQGCPCCGDVRMVTRGRATSWASDAPLLERKPEPE